MARKCVRKSESQNDRQRIVESRFQFEHDRNASFGLQPTCPQNREDSRRVGRRNNRAKQHSLRPWKAEQTCAQRHRPGDPSGRRYESRPNASADPIQRRVQSTVEEDEDQRARTEGERKLVIVRRRAAKPFATNQHSQHNKQQKLRPADFGRSPAEQNAYSEQ